MKTVELRRTAILELAGGNLLGAHLCQYSCLHLSLLVICTLLSSNNEGKDCLIALVRTLILHKLLKVLIK